MSLIFFYSHTLRLSLSAFSPLATFLLHSFRFFVNTCFLTNLRVFSSLYSDKPYFMVSIFSPHNLHILFQFSCQINLFSRFLFQHSDNVLRQFFFNAIFGFSNIFVFLSTPSFLLAVQVMFLLHPLLLFDFFSA